MFNRKSIDAARHPWLRDSDFLAGMIGAEKIRYYHLRTLKFGFSFIPLLKQRFTGKNLPNPNHLAKLPGQ